MRAHLNSFPLPALPCYPLPQIYSSFSYYTVLTKFSSSQQLFPLPLPPFCISKYCLSIIFFLLSLPFHYLFSSILPFIPLLLYSLSIIFFLLFLPFHYLFSSFSLSYFSNIPFNISTSSRNLFFFT